ncbi:MAG: T9SS type A sorting domain-containing protein [Muribaculaceae bacterium]
MIPITRRLCLLAALAAAAAMPTAALADGGAYRSVVVEMVNGSHSVINIVDGLTTTFSTLQIKFQGAGTSVSIPKSSVAALTFSEQAGISDAHISGDNISLSNLPAGSDVNIYDTAGRLLHHSTATEGNLNLRLSSLSPSAVYIVNVNGINYKIGVK